MDLFFIIKEFIKTRNLQEWINHRYKSGNGVIISKEELLKYFSDSGIYFNPPVYLTEIVDTIFYHVDQVRPEDIVIDIGANIGGFSLQAAKHNPSVYAIEPIFYKEIERNAELSNI